MQAVGRFKDSASVLLVAAVALFGGLLLPATAQLHGVPASVTSNGFGGNFSSHPGVPASVTSIGPLGFGNHPRFFSQPFFNGTFQNNNGFQHHHHHQGFFGGGFPVVSYGYPYAYPVAVPVAVPDDYDDDQYNGGPTIFDRRGSGPSNRQEEEHYRRDDRDDREDAPETRNSEPAAQEPVANQPATAVVFKDGHSIELSNYAIIGPTLYDLTPGHNRKILLADIDVPATEKQNDDRGVDFNLPPTQQ
jgi:hypothetical protein